jgi:hypothetical protein
MNNPHCKIGKVTYKTNIRLLDTSYDIEKSISNQIGSFKSIADTSKGDAMIVAYTKGDLYNVRMYGRIFDLKSLSGMIDLEIEDVRHK